jgi:hypothetical protein
MKTQRLVLALGALNLVVMLVLLVAEIRPGEAQTAPGVLRGTSMEIVDNAGRVRASIKVEPPSTVGGVAYPETVVLRLVNPDGRPVIKVAASVDGGGLGVIGKDDTTYATLNATPTGTTLSFLQKDGRRIVLGQ